MKTKFIIITATLLFIAPSLFGQVPQQIPTVSESRFFLASNFAVLDDNGKLSATKSNEATVSDLLYNWEQKIGAPAVVRTPNNLLKTFEWRVGNNQHLIDGEYILKDLQSAPLHLLPTTTTLYCDFIYRIDKDDFDQRRISSGDETIDAQAPLFVVEYYLRYKEHPEDSNSPMLTHLVANTSSDDITFYSSQHPSYPEGESREIMFFPNAAKYQPMVMIGDNPLKSHQYAIQRKVFDCFFDSTLNGTPHRYQAINIECRLRAAHQEGNPKANVGIYIRGLRVRSNRE